MSDFAVKASDLHKSYRLGKVPLHVLRGVSLSVKKGEFVCVVGASGSGKSTLLHVIGLIDKADKGRVMLDGTDVAKLSARRRSRLRCREVGFVFQFYHLLPELNVFENTLLPSMVD
ncbi:MAG: ATP-binding cassette domain-containing protein, partial [Phycisphaerae bacterium]